MQQQKLGTLPTLTQKFDLRYLLDIPDETYANDTGINPFTAMVVTNRDGCNKLTVPEFKYP